MTRTTAVLLCAVLSGLTVRSSAQTPAPHRLCSFKARITDEDGGPVRAFVLLRGKRAAVAGQQLPVAKDGEIKASLGAGLYDLFVSAPGFLPLAQVVDLRACQSPALNLTLMIDSEHTEKDR